MKKLILNSTIWPEVDNYIDELVIRYEKKEQLNEYNKAFIEFFLEVQKNQNVHDRAKN